MRHATRIIIVVSGMIAAGLGSMARGAAATTQPQAAAGKVVVLPFAQAGPGPSQAWVGQAIRQGVLSSLMPYAPGRVQPLDERAADDRAAIDAGRKSGAAYVVIGDVVTVGPTVRFNGRVLDAESGQAVAPLRATGPADDLSALEIAVAQQLGRAIGLTMPAAPATPPLAPAAGSGANPWGTNDYLTANPYEPGGAGEAAAATGGADFGPNGSGYGAFPYGPYLGPVFVTPGGRHRHNHGSGSQAFGGAGSEFDDTPFNTMGFPSIAGGGGNAALNGGMPFGLFIPTNRAQSRVFNRFGGTGTVDISRPTGPARHATGGHAGRK